MLTSINKPKNQVDKGMANCEGLFVGKNIINGERLFGRQQTMSKLCLK